MFVDQVANEEDDGQMTKNVPSAIVEAITSCFISNINVLMKLFIQ